jgi:hypothetical protein
LLAYAAAVVVAAVELAAGGGSGLCTAVVAGSSRGPDRSTATRSSSAANVRLPTTTSAARPMSELKAATASPVS